MATGFLDAVRRHCAVVSTAARWVRIDPVARVSGVREGRLDPGVHYLEGDREAVARFVLIADAINFGSGWFDELGTGYDAITGALTAHARARGGPWRADELRELDARAVAAVLPLDAVHALARHYATALNQLGAWLGERSALDAIAAAGGSGERLAAALAAGMPYFDDRGFYKRAQITVNDLALAGVATFADVDALTIFADNLVPHVLRVDGVLEYAPELARRVDAGELLAAGSAMEVEVRACALHACEGLAAGAGVPPRVLDTWLWTRGQGPPYDAGAPHRTRTVFY